ncbi:hypothetical protein RclHR1_08690008 [Rhizophagus clarus]|uniref:F-box domain-containing protein n=1 Tax=Rhizophagus clarus TaxID=94130 RepID=A0A2Z6SCL9_9GLOM|nr:hypothetical protein RclHR1_08690008 [Rhizophagus clarus]GES78672.1 hypothetical protein GLOIN_2v1473747 [Rhizophagus clarus]
MLYLIEDCLRIIFNELKYDLNSLYSCILVNRLWCRVAIPILWKRNFDTEILSYYKLYNAIIYLLPITSKMILINNIDNENIFPSTIRPLFNYIRISSQVPSRFIEEMIEALIKKEDKFVSYKRNLLEQEVYKLFVSNCKDIKHFLLKTTQHLYQFPGASTCFSQLCVLTIDISRVTSTILFGMAIICENIEDLKIFQCDRDIPGLNRLIDVQTKLKSLRLHEFYNTEKQCKELNKVIGKKANTLQEIELVGPSVTSLLPKFLPLLKNLRSLKLCNELYDVSEESQEWEKYLSISSFPNLQYLETEYLPFYNDCLLIEKSHGNILEINISQDSNSIYHYTKKLINTIINYNSNIERLIINIKFENFDDIKEIFLNCNQLKMIDLSLYNENNLNCDGFFEILIKYSPKTLCKIYFSDDEWIFTVNGLKSFFENWKNWKAQILFYRVEFTNEHMMVIEKFKVLLNLLVINGTN